MKQLIPALILLLLSTGAIAEEVVKYVNDYLLITLRSGPGLEFKIEKNLGTGTRVAILEKSEDGRFSRVRTDKGIEGWVLSQYLVSKPVARLQLKQAQSELEELKKEHETLQQRHDKVSQQGRVSGKELDHSQKQLKIVNEALNTLKEVAAKPIFFERENSRLTNEMIELKNRLRITEEKNDALEDSESRQWFSIGALVLFSGIILGLILPKLKSRRRDSWGD